MSSIALTPLNTHCAPLGYSFHTPSHFVWYTWWWSVNVTGRCHSGGLMGRGPDDLPSSGTPGGTAEKKDSTGNVIQRRYYGPDGRAEKNVDYGHDFEGVGDPHAHDWDWTKRPARQRARALKPGE
jgi:hypothetical protein